MRFVSATTVDEALAAMADGARPVAGGTDLVVGHRQGKAPLPPFVVSIDRIAALHTIAPDGEALQVGALVTHHEIEQHPTVVSRFAALADASALVGSPATRNVGTLGGNVMNASPAMDTGAPLVVLGAEVELRSVRGARWVPVGELWTGPGRTCAVADELCTAIRLPHPGNQSASAYVRLEYRRAMEIAVVGAAAAVTLAPDGSVASASLALTAVAPTIVAVTGLDAVTGCSPAQLVERAASLAAEQATPISDLRASDRYRRHCVAVMAGRAVDAAARRAAGEVVPVPVNRALGIGATS